MHMRKNYYGGALSLKLQEHETFLLQRFEKEWNAIQKAERRKGRLEKLKAGGKVVGKIVLGLLAVGGVFTIALVAPKMFVLFDSRSNRRVFLSEDDFSRTRQVFKRRKFISLKPRGDGVYAIAITEKGKERALGEIYRDLKLEKRKKWDGVWRVVIFDISEKHKGEREGFRHRLEQLGLHRLQESVFVSPHPCKEEVYFLISLFGVGAYTRFFTTADLGDVETLKRHFNL